MRLGTFFPWPLVGVALLLVALIVFTPVLLSTASGPYYTQAVLVVDRVAGPNLTTNFYVHAIGGTVRYQTISMAIAYGFNWSGGFPSENLSWYDWENLTDALEYSYYAPFNPVVVAVTATYVSGSTTSAYSGVLAFYVSGLGTSHEVLNAVTAPGSSGVTVAPSTPVSSLPLILSLQPGTIGGFP